MAELNKLVTISMDDEQIKKVVSIDVMKIHADTLQVKDNLDYELAADMIGNISSRITELDNMRKKLKTPILEAGRNIDAMFKVPLDQGRAAKKTVQTKMLDYVAKVEQERQEAEAQAAKKAEEAKLKAEEEALALMANGDDEAAQEILDNVDIMPVPTKTIESPKAAGISTRSNWKCRVTDLNLLIRSIIKGVAPISLIQIDTIAANKYAKALKDTLPIEGLEFYNDETLAVRKVKGIHEKNTAAF